MSKYGKLLIDTTIGFLVSFFVFFAFIAFIAFKKQSMEVVVDSIVLFLMFFFYPFLHVFELLHVFPVFVVLVALSFFIFTKTNLLCKYLLSLIILVWVSYGALCVAIVTGGA